MKCKDCIYLKPMKPDPDLMVCKNKNSQWYVVDPERDKCKYFEGDSSGRPRTNNQ